MQPSQLFKATALRLFFLLLPMLAFLLMNKARAQDIHFSQFYENSGLRNPGLTGIFSGDYKAGVNYRTQWSTLASPYQTVLATAELRKMVNEETGDCISFGLTTTYDNAGAINFSSLQVMPAIAFNKAFSDKHASYLSLGFSGAYQQRSVDPSKMTFDNQYVNGGYQAGSATGETMSFATVRHFDVSAGASLNSSLGESNQVNYYIGAGAFHLNRPKAAFNDNENFVRLPVRWTGQLGVRWQQQGGPMGFTTHVNYNQQDGARELIGGGLLSYQTRDENFPEREFTLYAGCFYRVGDALIPTVKGDYGRYSLTMSYDRNISSLKPGTNGTGGWEMSLYVRGNLKKEINQMRCPRFEMLIPAFE
jgi:type IX secretion system PorP/SprF family membrane protein